jgi:flavorubredoxin
MTSAIDNYPPHAPVNHHAPLKIAEDSYLIRQVFSEGEPMAVYVNSMVITGREPVIVDTGTVANRKDWLNDVFSLVDPKDVRWVFISHDDHDHVGNLPEVLDLCTNATLISSWFQVERLAGDIGLPLNRMRWVGDGEAFDAGDRLLVAIRPPTFDAPTTRGLYDSKSRVYWAGDSFATPMPAVVENVTDLDEEFWKMGFHMFQSAVSPWHTMLDPVKYNKHVDRVAELDLQVVAGGHSPLTTGPQIRKAIEMLRQLPFQPEAQLPGQDVLDMILAQITAAPVAA